MKKKENDKMKDQEVAKIIKKEENKQQKQLNACLNTTLTWGGPPRVLAPGTWAPG